MSHEISQLDIQNHQLLPSNAQPSIWTEIGEAQITHTIFGRAKVRIIRKHDNKRRLLLLVVLMLTALAAAAWQGWFASQQTEPQQNAGLPTSVSAKVQGSAPAFQPENIAPPAIPALVEGKPGTPVQTEINNPAISQKSEPQPSSGLKGDGQITAKPVKARPLTARKPQEAALATDNNTLKNQADKPLPPRLSPSKQSVAPAVAIPRATPPAAQTAASSPVAVVPLAAPLVKEDTSTQSPAGDKQPPVSVDSQSQ